MDRDDEKPKVFVSTFRVALRPRSHLRHAVKRRESSVNSTSRTSAGKDTPGGSSTEEATRATIQRVEAPQFKEALEDCSVCLGDGVTFQGVITGTQPLSVSWLHDGTKEFPGQRLNKENSLKSCERAEASSASEERGQIEKQDFNPDTNQPPARPPTSSPFEVSRDPSLQTEDRKGPVVEFLAPSEKLEVCVGERAQILCDFRSSSLPVACCWIYNRTKVVSGGPRVSIGTKTTQSSVEILQAIPEDTGSYTLVVRNRLGFARHTVSLAVVDRPTPPSSPPVASRVSTHSLVLSWAGPSYDGGSAVSGYIVEVTQDCMDESQTWSEVTRCENTSCHVGSGLDPKGLYRFRVRACNSAGTSEPSQESHWVKMANGKEKKKEPETYVTVIIDTKHKVRDHYNVHEKLGVGKFGEVYRLTHKESGQEVACKFYRARTSKDKTAARSEIEIMGKLHHPKLIQCLAAYETRSELAMVMEYVLGGELFERIVDENFEHTEPTSARYMQQILEGVQFMHKQKIIHLDLKPENIVCVDTYGMQIKIIDFGLAKELVDGKPLMVMHGTPEFVAPEVIGYEPVGIETDMWSIGVICFILLSGESPFQGNNDAETLAMVTAARYEFDPESFEEISDEAKDFISSLLKKDKRARMSCTEALAHSWMASFTPLNRRPTKSLRKDKMKRFLARRKWKKTGQAVLALNRMANFTNRPDSPGNHLDEPGWSPEAESAIQALDEELQTEPRFQQVLKDVALPAGATARLSCLVNGYPLPEVEWLHNEGPVDSSRVTVQQLEDGLCSLVVAELMLSDSGVYVCRAKNPLGEAVCSAKLKVVL